MCYAIIQSHTFAHEITCSNEHHFVSWMTQQSASFTNSLTLSSYSTSLAVVQSLLHYLIFLLSICTAREVVEWRKFQCLARRLQDICTTITEMIDDAIVVDSMIMMAFFGANCADAFIPFSSASCTFVPFMTDVVLTIKRISTNDILARCATAIGLVEA